MPYYPRVMPTGSGFAALVDSHYANGIYVSDGFETEAEAQSVAQAVAKGFNLRDYEQLRAMGLSDADLPQPSDTASEPVTA